LPLELVAVGAGAPVQPAPALPPALRGAELVHLAEELYVRMFAVACAMTLAGGGLALAFAALDRGAPAPATIAFTAAATAFAAIGVARPREVYGRLRSRAALQLAPAALGALAVLADGPESECWWFALPLLCVVATLSSTPLALAAAVGTATAFVAGTLLGGQPLAAPGDLGALPATFALPAYTLLARVIVDGFVGLVLGRHRLASELRYSRSEPIRVRGLAHEAPSASASPTPRRRPQPVSRLTARQLEVALLLRDGLRQTEVAACLGISVRQVERLLLAARERVGAATTTQLVAMLATGALSRR
jgi:DNA-binding CsgD family transcriptional regulator